MFMRTVQKIVFLILNSVPVTSVTDPVLIRPSIPVMTHSLDQIVVARKAKAKKCAAEVAGNIQVSISLSVKNGLRTSRKRFGLSTESSEGSRVSAPPKKVRLVVPGICSLTFVTMPAHNGQPSQGLGGLEFKEQNSNHVEPYYHNRHTAQSR